MATYWENSCSFGLRCVSWYKYQDPVVQSIVSLTISLRHKFVKQISAKVTNIQLFFSSPEPSGSQGELIVYPCSVVRPSVRPSSVRPSFRRPHFSKIFSSETAWPIKAKFYMKHLWEGGTNVYINNPGHMTKMAAMPIYGKNPSKIFFSGTTGPISTKLGMKH